MSFGEPITLSITNVSSEEECERLYPTIHESGCPRFHQWLDKQSFCWPSVEPKTIVNLPCPNHPAFDTKEFAYRICTENGTWDNNKRYDLRETGYTYFNGCILPHLRVYAKYCEKITWDTCTEVIGTTRTIEMVGLPMSILLLLLSLFIFYRYRILRNNRTKIHKNLFIATVLHMLVRLIIYIEQTYDVMSDINGSNSLCKMLNILLEYARTTMFMWMFIEGLYLHNIITVTVFQEHSYIKLYLFIGWGAPIIMTAIWVIAMVFEYNTYCWRFYNFLSYYWILEGPRSLIIVVNMLFLLNIIRVLVVKLQQTHTSEIEKVRKAVRAAIFLLPLMGTANLLFLIDFRQLDARKFALWSYTTHFLSTFQGFFIAVLYCFLNGEVRTVLRNTFYIHIYHRYPTRSQNETALSGFNVNP